MLGTVVIDGEITYITPLGLTKEEGDNENDVGFVASTMRPLGHYGLFLC